MNRKAAETSKHAIRHVLTLHTKRCLPGSFLISPLIIHALLIGSRTLVSGHYNCPALCLVTLECPTIDADCLLNVIIPFEYMAFSKAKRTREKEREGDNNTDRVDEFHNRPLGRLDTNWPASVANGKWRNAASATRAPTVDECTRRPCVYSIRGPSSEHWSGAWVAAASFTPRSLSRARALLNSLPFRASEKKANARRLSLPTGS